MPDPDQNQEKKLSSALSSLTALHRDCGGVLEVVAIGERAIPALKELLFEREPSGLYQVRCRAVQALGMIGAFDVIEEFLRRSKPADDPVERVGDDAVISAAALAMARKGDLRTFTILRGLASRRPLIGVISALASYQRCEAVPVLINALGEDECRHAAESALLSLGSRIGRQLLEATDCFKVSEPSFVVGRHIAQAHARR
ncbi:HEAT repeat domain-containing protein [Bradyrhizobium tropiciagri]|uniref:HEAT repeat domain-containing protein n=1 Tax=Bradyrhizobium tropiciagri TaxID=312253 RepID=UPI00067AE269|nr:hypothetical protein [Bradyrhizobium tropiciagri]